MPENFGAVFHQKVEKDCLQGAASREVDADKSATVVELAKVVEPVTLARAASAAAKCEFDPQNPEQIGKLFGLHSADAKSRGGE